MFLSGSQMETISTGATWTSRHRSLLPYHPAPINPTRRGLPLTRSSASAPNERNAARAASADVDWRKRRRLMWKPAPDVEWKAVLFMPELLAAPVGVCNHSLHATWMRRSIVPIDSASVIYFDCLGKHIRPAFGETTMPQVSQPSSRKL